jgi:hypothetical protein
MRYFMRGLKSTTLISIILVIISAFLLTACDEKDPLIATWQEPVSGITMKFTEEGNLVISNQKTSLSVTYEKQEPNTLVVKASSDGSYPGQTMLYRIEEDRLILTLDGQETVFTLVE